jgi:C1A family cysteine protease
MKKELKRRTMKSLKLTGLGLMLSLWLLLAGCGNGTSNLDGFFTKDKEWPGEIPSDAEIISSEEFKRRVEAGELEIITPAILEAQKQAQQKAYQDNIAFLQGIPNKDPYITALLEGAASKPTFEGDQPIVRPDGKTVSVLGLGAEINQAVETYQALQSVDNALDDYTLTYTLLPENLKTQATIPESLKGKSLAEVQAALSNLNTLLGGLSATALDGVRLETETEPSSLQPQAFNAGNGTDNVGVCTQTGLFNQFWFPLKNFVSPVKWQGKRGTCWAFTAIGAIESRERVQNDNPVDLSEQFFVNKVKQDWDSDDDSDGYHAETALKEAADHNQALLEEAAWTYNQSPNRPSETDYANSCDNYTGDCSLSSHQSRRVCEKRVLGHDCGYVTYTFDGPGVAPSRVTYLWRWGEDRFDLNRYRLLLSQGYVLLASFPVYRGFDRPTNGFVTPYDRTHFIFDDKGNIVGDAPGPNGSHAVQIVGFIGNEQLASVKPTIAPAGGGGYFIIKNSWGCGYGDGGYSYAPAQYVDTLFTQLSVLNFDARRSEAWNYDQAGGSLAAAIEIKANPARVDLRVSTNLADFFKVTHPIAAGVTLRVTDGATVVYDGGWTIRGGFPPSMPYTFTTPGRHVLTLAATNKGSTTTTTLNVDVVGNPPTLRFENSGSPRQGEDYFITALVRDVNENDSSVLCNNTIWVVDAPDTLSNATGCLQTVKFGTTGSRQVRVTTRDSDGLSTSQTLTLTVLPPPENPYPRITSYGVYSWDATGVACGNVSVPNGNTIDLRQKGCIDSVTPRDRYSASVEVENPSGETLNYDWKLFITDQGQDFQYSGAPGSGDPSFTLRNLYNSGEGTLDCRVTVQVNAPEPSRNKFLTVWQGKCTLDTFNVN